MEKINGISNIKNIQKSAADYHSLSFRAQGSSLERTPEQDSFYDTQKKQETKSMLKKAGLLLAGAAAVYLAYRAGKGASVQELSAAVSKNQDNEKTIKGLQDTIETLERKVSGASAAPAVQHASPEELAKQQKLLQQMTDALEPQLENSANAQKAHEILVQSIEAGLQNPKLGYDPLDAPIEQTGHALYGRIYKIGEVSEFIPAGVSNKGIIQPDVLKSEFAETGRLEISLPSTDKVKPSQSSEAFIGSKQVQGLNQTLETDFTTDYGARIAWSERKIARDIVQNFYDGNGNTLDGVTLLLEKQSDGSTRIKISGLGVYDYRKLQLLGSGNKIENGFNAGGFGEGSKILAVNLLGKGNTSAVTYACADWQYILSAPEAGSNVIRRTLKQMPDAVQGSSIEFTTKNQALIDSVIDSVNFFQHSKNPDFQGLTYDSKDFAFKILGGNKKGNVYLTQRFEFEGEGRWESSVDTMDIIFKRRPDADEYFKITGQKLPKDRDRTALTFEDIEHLTHYFAHSMKDEEIIQSILSTQKMWGTNALNYSRDSQSALKSFLKGMLSEADSRNLKFDIQAERYAALSEYENDTVINALRSYGYKLLPSEFSKIGIENTSSAFKKLSVHTPLEPSEIEIKKLKLLEQGLAIVQENTQRALQSHLAKADIQLIPEHCRQSYYDFNNIIKLLSQKDGSFAGLMVGTAVDKEKLEHMTDEEFSKLCAQVSNAVNKLLKSSAEKPDSRVISSLSSNLLSLKKDAMSVKSRDYIRTMYDYNLITASDVTKPRYIFDRHNEIAENTLGEAIIDLNEYNGHWIDREYLNTADFFQLLGTWVHECCHKSGGDGTEKFTYALTDMLRVLLRSNSSKLNSAKLGALAEVFNRLQ